jgi:hypothetical protein
MSLSDDVDLEEFVLAKDELSGADIKAVCTEAGLLALRERRMRVQMSDLRGAREKVLFRKKDEGPAGLCECSPHGFPHAREQLLTFAFRCSLRCVQTCRLTFVHSFCFATSHATEPTCRDPCCTCPTSLQAGPGA